MSGRLTVPPESCLSLPLQGSDDDCGDHSLLFNVGSEDQTRVLLLVGHVLYHRRYLSSAQRGCSARHTSVKEGRRH